MSDVLFKDIFIELKKLMGKFEKDLIIIKDLQEIYYLSCGISTKFGREIIFGAIQINKNYVSYHLFPIYMYPELFNNISPELNKRKQGKACFNFKKIDQALFNELDDLTTRSFNRYKLEGLVPVK